MQNIGVASAMTGILLSEQLKENTKTQHQLLEKQIIPRMKAITSTKEYASLLMLFYSFFGGVELLVDKTFNNDCLPDYLHRRKTASLRADLYAMNIAVEPLANGGDLPQIENHLQAAGAMYVMEGSTLGGVHISKMIGTQLMPANTNAFSFFNGYQSETQKMWQVFTSAMNSMLLDENEEQIVIDAANDTFLQFSNWIKQH